MKIEYTTAQSFVRLVRQVPKVIVMSIALGISISLFANDGNVAAMPRLQYDTNRQLVELVDNTHAVSVPSSDNEEVCYIFNSNEENTADKLLSSFERLKINEQEEAVYGETFARMSTQISSLPFIKTSADIDQRTKTLELFGVLPSGILMTIAKPYTTLADNNALLTIVYHREVIMSTLIDMKELKDRMMDVESKLIG